MKKEKPPKYINESYQYTGCPPDGFVPAVGEIRPMIQFGCEYECISVKSDSDKYVTNEKDFLSKVP